MDYREVLREYFGYDSFRSIQEDIIRSIGSGRDTLGLMPTGGGKSITFQVPALAQEGVCIVITPLIALMKDQVAKLRERGIKATAIYSGMSRDSIVAALDNCILGGYKFLYISPERLTSDIFLSKLRRMQVSFITIDESHCISQWGYDFRPSYLAIADIRKQLPSIPVLALTATATPEVVKDIQARLQFREENVFRMSFERKNLNYIVRHTENKDAEMLHILSSVQGAAIVYVRNRDKTREISRLLADHGVSATFYHAGIDSRDGVRGASVLWWPPMLLEWVSTNQMCVWSFIMRCPILPRHTIRRQVVLVVTDSPPMPYFFMLLTTNANCRAVLTTTTLTKPLSAASTSVSVTTTRWP